MRIVPVLFAALLAGWCGQHASAQRSLYGAQADREAAHVRVVNALDAEVAISSAVLPAQTLGSRPDQRVGAYAVVGRVAARPLALDVRQGGHIVHLTVRVEPGSYTSIVLQPDGDGRPGAVAAPRPAEFNQARALLSFYNAAPRCGSASLLLEPGDVPVFQDVAPGTVKSRSINPATATVNAACPDRPAATTRLEGLEPGGSYSLWLMVLQGTPTVFLSADKAADWHP